MVDTVNHSQVSQASEWKPFAGRVTFFPTMSKSSAPPSVLDLYRQIWGGEPNAFRKPPNPLLPSHVQGRRGGLTINCTTHPARIDFNLRAIESPQMTINLIRHPSEFRDELMRIIKFPEKSALLGNISRVALILHFVNVKPSHAEANKALIAVMPDPYRVSITHEEDFIFQVNQPHTSRKFQDIRMNFVTKWSVDQLRILAIPFPIGGLPVQEGNIWPPQQSRTVIVASVLFDINNSSPTPGRTLTGEEQSALLQEAFDEGVQRQQTIRLNIEGF